MSTPTPRTDAEEYPEGEGQSFQVVSADFARTLERELNAERARLDWLRDNVEEIYSKDQHGIVYLSGENIRDAIDAAMKGDAK
jgi:hypothetical protein